MSWPVNPIAAVTHPDPYPYYAALVAENPWYFDAQINMWVASGAQAVKTVMAHELCRVRPVAEKVPRALQQTPAGIIFSNLVRMNDGALHQRTKRAVISGLAGAGDEIASKAHCLAKSLWQSLAAQDFRQSLSAFQLNFPMHVMGHLLGFSAETLPMLGIWMNDFVRCLAPGSRPEYVHAGVMAAEKLLDLFRSQLSRSPLDPGLLAQLQRAMEEVGVDDIDCIAANGIGFLSQAYEATAGLIANTCLALARQPAVDDAVRNHPSRLPAVIRETLRLDPPVQNTRRFLAADAEIDGRPLRAGDTVLLILAGESSFGAGVHRCPGEDLAFTITKVALEFLLGLNQDFSALPSTIHYRNSVNTRVALFSQEASL